MSDDTPSDVDQLCADTYTTIARLPNIPDPHIDTDSLSHQTDALTSALNLLRDRQRAWALELGDRIAANYDYQPTEGVNIDGVIWHHETPQTVKWDGQGVLDELTVAIPDAETGELHYVVPRHVLDDVIAAVGKGKTSSKWQKRGLERHGVNVRRVRSVTYGEPIAKQGPAT